MLLTKSLSWTTVEDSSFLCAWIKAGLCPYRVIMDNVVHYHLSLIFKEMVKELHLHVGQIMGHFLWLFRPNSDFGEVEWSCLVCCSIRF